MALSRLDSKLESTLAEIDEISEKSGFELTLPRSIQTRIIEDGGFNKLTFTAAFVLMQLAQQYQPINVRGVMYRAIGILFKDSSQLNYEQTGRVVLKLRRADIMPFEWIVDTTRRRLKPNSWRTLSECAQSLSQIYRKDLWAAQKHHVEIFVEKDAMVGVVEPVTDELDNFCTIIRGHNSETSIWNTAEEWNEIDKPIFVYYLGDHDPDGLRIESSLVSKVVLLSILTDLFGGNASRFRKRISLMKLCADTL